MARERELLDVVQLVGPDALAPPERVTLRTGRLLREVFLQQNAFDDHDAARPMSSHLAILAAVRDTHDAMLAAAERDVPIDDIVTAPALAALRAEPDLTLPDTARAAAAARQQLAAL